MPEGLPPGIDEAAEKSRLAEEKKQLKKERKAQKKEVKSRAKDLVRQERQLESENDPKGASVFVVTLVIVLIWLAILALLVKLDVGGFGSGILQPILKDIPVINRILPTGTMQPFNPNEPEAYQGFTDIREAVEYIRQLEHDLDRSLANVTNSTNEIAELRAQVERLKSFEDRQVEFQRILDEFYDEVIYSDKGPGPEGYRKFFESIDPSAAERLYKQVVVELEESGEIRDFARAYSEMRPRDAAAIFEAMTDNLDLAARILNAMNAANRGAILGQMDADVAAQLTKIMEPR
ncbi:MAG: hypothetical protein FWE14_10230 [Lachnospiraceae bacterium]|nr:hypothetical protein [Lachnospiraceae bacterium]